MAKKPENMIPPIEAAFDDVVDAIAPKAAKAATPEGSNFKYLGKVSASEAATLIQLALDLGIEIEKNVNGIEMGVLQNGMPYLTQRGLSQMSGAARSTIQSFTQEWEQTYGDPIPPKGRMAFFKNYLFEKGYDEPRLFIEISKNGSPHYAYTDLVCMAFIEYFAFEAQSTNDTALTNFRNLARFGLEKFIYQALDYSPRDPFELHNARLSILKDSAPAGYFIIFKETAGLIIDLIVNGLPVNEHTMPDGSVGGTWGRYWTANGLEGSLGERIQYDHYFPDEYPQSASNPQTAWAYPEDALPTFRRWFREVYLPTKYPNYILKKAKVLTGGKEEAQKIANLYNPNQIES